MQNQQDWVALRALLKQAVTDIFRHGTGNLKTWQSRIVSFMSSIELTPTQAREHAEKVLFSEFEQRFKEKSVIRRQKGIELYTFEQLKPKLQNQLSDRVRGFTELIVVGGETNIQRQKQRLSGWGVNLIQPNGAVLKKDVEAVVDAIQPTERERYHIRFQDNDQTHKLIAALDKLIADDGGALAVTWNQHWTLNPRNKGTSPKTNHKQFDGKTFILKDCWAVKDELIKAGELKYYENLGDVIGENYNCTCSGTYLYSINELYQIRPDCFTEKGLRFIGR